MEPIFEGPNPRGSVKVLPMHAGLIDDSTIYFIVFWSPFGFSLEKATCD